MGRTPSGRADGGEGGQEGRNYKREWGIGNWESF